MACWSKASFASSTPFREQTISEHGDGQSPVILPCRGGFARYLDYSSSPSLSARSSNILTEEGCQLVRPRGVRSRKAASSGGPSGEAAPKAKGRRSRMPLLVIAHSPNKSAALAGLERWKARYPSAAARLAPDDVLVDAMRGRSSTWTRVRVNLRHVPEAERPPQEPPDPDEDPTRAWRERAHGRHQPERKPEPEE